MSSNNQTNTTQFLLEKFKQERDMDALRVLYERHYQEIYFRVYKDIGNKEETEDAVQDAFLKILAYQETKAEKLPKASSFVAWISKVSRNIWLEKNRTETRRDKIMNDKIVPTKKKAAYINIGLDIERFKVCISRIKNPKLRAILELVIQGFSNKEIADKLGYDESYIRKRKYDARKELKKILHAIGFL